MAASLLGSVHPARAATFIVTTTDDGGAGSLRQAMLDANATPGLDAISFNIPGDGVRVIAVTSALPEVTDPVIIDGYTQPGAAPNSLAVGSDAVILIELDGTAAGDAVNGFYLTAGGSTIRGLAITYFTYAGIEIDYGGANTIAGNHIGLDASGAVAKRNGVGTMWDGIVIGWISSSGANVIGGQAPADRNVISANEGAGIWMTATSGGNVIRGNYIGTNAAGTAAIANGQYGILLAGPGDEVIDNVISANAAGYPGILAPAAASATIIRGNRIGTTADGTGALGNGGPGIQLESADNIVGGTAAGDANLIAHNAGAGVVVTAGNVGNAILGNSIHSNTGIGIDLGGNGVSVNNGSKSSTQANRGMDAPVFTAASVSGGQVTVAGYVGSQIGQSVFANARVEVFLSDTDASGYGEGRTYLGTVTTGAQGSFSGSLPAPGLTTGSRLTATATDTLNDTSEFGPQFVATNVAPVLTGANTLASLSEDPVSDPGTLVSALIATHTSDDGPGGVASGIAVTGVDNANGAWQYTIDGGTTWADFGSPSGTASRLLSATALTSVRFVPFAHWTGTVASGLTFRAWDESTGTPGATADTTVTGGAAAFSVATASASITVGAVNDAPTFVVGDGIVTTNVAGASMDFHQAVLVQPDGKIVAAGYTSTTTKDIVVARYNGDGSLDTTFGGGDGIVVRPVGASDDVANAIVRRADGRLLVVGQTFNGSDTDVALVQFTSTGDIDATFGGGDGIATSGLAGSDEGYDVAVQADGRILVGSQGSSNLQVVRFNADGARDTTFGTGGLVEIDVAGGNDRTYAIALDADGRILLAGSAVVGPNVDIVVVRLTAAGVLDTSFNGTGKVTVDIGTSSSDTGYAMTLQPDGRILVAGWSDAPGSTQFAVIRLTSAGSLDTTFGGDGTITVDVGTSSGSKLALDVVVQPDGRILVGGTGNSNGNNLGVVRLTAAGVLDQSFGGGDGIVETTISTYSDERAQALALQADGRIVVAGTTNAPGNYDLLVARYTASGAIDVAFEGVDTLGGTVSYIENGPVLALDANVTVFDADLDSASSYGGATLTLARHGGASAEDLFTSTSMVMTPGGSLSYGGVAFATVTTIAGGTLVLTFNANATPALVTTALRSIGYRNSSDAPPSSVQIDWTFSDGNTGAQGPGSALSATGTTLVSIAPVNDAPVLTGVANLSAIDEDAIQNPGTPVATLVAGRISDAEGTNGLGIAITGIDSAHGSWQFTMGPGTTWQTLSAASDASALLLAADGGAAIRFVPASNWNGTVAAGLTIRAWDGTSGKAGTTANTSTNGGSTAFSSATASASVTVTASNDAPTSANDAITVSATGAGLAGGSLRWSVDYLVDVSQPVLGESQATGPRDSRGLALDATGRYLYVGYNNGGGDASIQVRRIDLQQPDPVSAVEARLSGVRGKAIDVDDVGRVYIADGAFIRIYDEKLSTLHHSVPATNVEGLDVRRESGQLALYVSDRTLNTVSRWVLDETGDRVEGAKRSGLGSDGEVRVAGAVSLRGIAVDGRGRVWVADPAADKVFRIDPDGTDIASVSVSDAVDLDVAGDTVVVARFYDRVLALVDGSMKVVQTIAVPWNALRLDPAGDGGAGSLSGIVVAPSGGIYVSNETGATADKRSTYGIADDRRGTIGGVDYTDITEADRDPVLRAVSNVLANDTDADGTTLVAELVTRPAHGAVTLAPNGDFSYVPDAGFVGQDAFTYRASDGALVSAAATVTIVVESAGAGITVTPTAGLSVTEAGSTATFSIVLASPPVADVTVSLESSDTTEGSVAPTSVTFTPGNWNAAQAVTVTGADDASADGAQAFTIVTAAASSADGAYAGLDPADVTVTTSDNDSASVIVTPPPGLAAVVSEAGSSVTFAVALGSQPAATVTIGLSSSDTTEGVVSPATLTFGPGNWNTAQVVTVTGVDDAAIDGTQVFSVVTAIAASTDAAYDGIDPADVLIATTDDDVAGITVTPDSGLTVTEAGGTATFAVVLASQPGADVSVSLSSSDTSEGTVAPASLTFTPATWNVAQVVTVTGVDDPAADGSQPFTIVTAAAQSADADYDGLDVSDVLVASVDDDAAGVTVTPTAGLVVNESGSAASFVIVLNTQPVAAVTFALVSSDTTEGTVSPATVTFGPGTWNQPQTVTVTGIDDAVADGSVAFSIVTGAGSSTDIDYADLDPADVSITTSDNDTAGITVAPTANLTVTEAGGTATFTVVLQTQPTADVTIDVSSSDLTEGTVAPAVLTFTPATWNAAQRVTVTGAADAVRDGDVAFVVVVAPAISSDGRYAGMDPVDVSVTNLEVRQVSAARGRVLSVGGQPVGGVTVYLTGAAVASMTTEADGTYRFADLEQGQAYVVIPVRDGYGFTPGAHAIDALDDDVVADFVAVRLYSLTGEVNDKNGSGVGGVQVELRCGTTHLVTTTGAGGRYAFDGVPEGASCTVTPEAPGFTFGPGTIVVTPGTTPEVAPIDVVEGLFTRYFAEGATGLFFDTNIALMNATDTAADVRVRFQRPDGVEGVVSVTMPPLSRATVNPEQLDEMRDTAVATVIESTQPIIADRTMHWDGMGYGSHSESSIAQPLTQWFLAEGTTAAGFQLFYLVQNPNTTDALVEVRYLLPSPQPPVVKTYTVPAGSRFNIWVNLEDAKLASTDVSAVVTSRNGVSVIVERSMYLSGHGRTFDAGHESAAIEAPARQWFLAEGATGAFFDLFTLIANPGDEAARVEVRYLLPAGAPVVRTYDVAPNSRFNIWVDWEDARLADTSVAQVITSTNGVPIVVERAMWWSADSWYEGHNSAGATQAGSKWAAAGGEESGRYAVETYILVANTNTFGGDVDVTVVFEDGVTETQRVAVAANARTTFRMRDWFPSTAGRRYGVVVEAVNPVMQLVVERANYNSAEGDFWGAGANALATRLR